LTHIYDQATERIQGQKHGFHSLAERALCWIIHAARPLTTRQLQHALSVGPRKSALDPDNLPLTQHMILACFGLVMVDKEGVNPPSLLYNARIFQQTNRLWVPNPQTDVASTCVTFPTNWVLSSTVVLRWVSQKLSLNGRVPGWKVFFKPPVFLISISNDGVGHVRDSILLSITTRVLQICRM
jgi:hypothetical protein